MSETVRVLRRFNRAIQECGTDSVRVVATAALRDARNSRAFLEWVRSTTGWTIEIISGLEEARLIHLGIVSARAPRQLAVFCWWTWAAAAANSRFRATGTFATR